MAKLIKFLVEKGWLRCKKEKLGYRCSGCDEHQERQLKTLLTRISKGRNKN